MATTFQRLCVRDHTIIAQNGDTLTLVRGKEYITSPVRDGLVTVYSTFWVKVPADLFAAEVPFTTDAAPPTPPAPDAVVDLEEVAIFLESLGSIPGTYAYAPTDECRQHAANLRAALSAPPATRREEFICEKCGYVGGAQRHEGCDYNAIPIPTPDARAGSEVVTAPCGCQVMRGWRCPDHGAP